MSKTKKRRKRKKRSKGKKRKRKTRKADFEGEKCAPKSKEKILDFTCYTSSSLHKLRELWNARHNDHKIISNEPREIWYALKRYLRRSCNRESCWLRQKFAKFNLTNELTNYTFAPKQPKEWKKKPYEWLSSVEISQVMKQYEKAYPCFEFLGPSPIDYDNHMMYGECVWEELCQFNLKSFIKRGKTKIGIVFNLDSHKKEGSHWMAMFIDVRKREIYWFDSYGEKSPRRLRKFMVKVQKQSKKLGDKYTIKENKIRHQYSRSECGMYCLYFIIELLRGRETFESLTTKRINDKLPKKLRKHYFNLNLNN